MIRVLACTSLLAVAGGVTFGQSAPSFDVADVHASARTTNPYMRGGAVRGGRYEVRTASVLDLISTAYSMESDKVVGGPSWLDTSRFDIIAKVPAGTNEATLKLMLQSLLAERFKLVVHKDSRALPGYALSMGKGKPKMKEAAAATGPGGCQSQPQDPAPEIPIINVACRNLTMEAFAQELRGMAAGAYLNSPVVDTTGLKGSWDFELKWHQRNQLARAGSDAITLFDAIDKQLGLKLDLQKITMPVMVVDSVNEKPTDNPAGVISKLPPPPPAEFEVADVKPSLPDAQQGGNFQNGRLDLRAYPLKQLIQAAWDINNPDLLAGAPKWTDSARFDVIAKASTDPATAQLADDDVLRLMLRALLVERFKLATHMEDRPVSGYTLSAAKPKLQKADPSNRTACKNGPGADGKDPRNGNLVLNRLISCQNMTMAQFAEQLPNLASGYVRTAVLDVTGLDGAYDFTFAFSGTNLLRGGGAQGGDAASDPNGAVSLPDALNKQLGLKLELQKRNMPVLVIDHLEEKPVDN